MKKKVRLTDEKRVITVRTTPNGYTLDVKGGDGWLYNDEDSLFKGLIYHVRLGMMKDADQRTLDDLYTAMLKWPNADEATVKANQMVAANERLTKTVKSQTATIKSQQRRIRELNKIIEDIRKQAETPKVKRKDLTPAPIKTTVSDKVRQALLTPITMKDTGLGRRAVGLLKYAGGKENHCIGDIAGMRRADIAKMRGAGEHVMEEIEKWFITHGLQFGMNVEAVLLAYQKNK